MWCSMTKLFPTSIKRIGIFNGKWEALNRKPQVARGWYVLSGYAAQRASDLQSGLYAVDQSTPQSRNFGRGGTLLPFSGGRWRLRRLSAFGRHPKSVADGQQFEDVGGLSGGRFAIWQCFHRSGHDVSNRSATLSFESGHPIRWLTRKCM